MRTAVVVFPGSNCDRDVQRAVAETLKTPVDMVWHEEREFASQPDLVILPGGFSYGDYLRSGAMAARSPIIEAVRRHPDLSVIYAGQDGDYMDSENDALYRWMLEGYKFNIRRVKDVLALEDPCIKISIYKEQDVEHAAADIREAFQDRMKITLAGEMWMDCMAQGVNKGQAVKRLQESLEIRPEETMAFGDQLNDIEMLQQAYYSFAVANAREEVRKLARFQADSNKNDGVLKVLKQLL